MTEPLLFALTRAGRAAPGAMGEVRATEMRVRPAAGWTIVAACLTRYEAWPIVGAAMALAALVEMAARRVLIADVVREIALAGDLSGADRDLLPRPELRIDRANGS